MIFADKLILLRKKAGWSQEELADQMNVTRQSVSKWEGAQSVPDLEKMLRLSELFGVSTDYLLKDEIEEAEHIDSSDDTPSLRRVSMEEANAFLSVKLRTAKTISVCRLFVYLISDCPFDIECNQRKYGRCLERKYCEWNRNDCSYHSCGNRRRDVYIKRQQNCPICLFGERKV